MAIAGRNRVVPLELRLQPERESNARGFKRLVLAVVTMLKWYWWHAKSYVPIAGILLLTGGSLLMLQCYWLSRPLLQTPAKEKEAIKGMDCIR